MFIVAGTVGAASSARRLFTNGSINDCHMVLRDSTGGRASFDEARAMSGALTVFACLSLGIIDVVVLLGAAQLLHSLTQL